MIATQTHGRRTHWGHQVISGREGAVIKIRNSFGTGGTQADVARTIVEI